MTDDEIQLYAMLTVQKTLIGMLFAQTALGLQNPNEAVETMRGQALRIVAKTWTPDPTATADIEKMRAAMIVMTEKLFAEIADRVRGAKPA